MADPARRLRLQCVFAHPDDETLGNGAMLARYAAEGVALSLVCATRGEHGWPDSATYPGPGELGRIREAELRAAAAILGFEEVHCLDYVDGALDQADPGEAIGLIAAHLRRFRPDVVVTFGPEGGYGHVDHIAICQLTTAACVEAAASGDGAHPAHAVAKLYYMAWPASTRAAYTALFGEVAMEFDGVVRRANAWPDWLITTRIDTAAYADVSWQAVLCHASQLQTYGRLAAATAEQRAAIYGQQTYYRAYSRVSGGRVVETDLFAGLR